MFSDLDWRNIESMTILHAEIKKRQICEHQADIFAGLVCDLAMSLFTRTPGWFREVESRHQIPMLVDAIMELTRIR